MSLCVISKEDLLDIYPLCYIGSPIIGKIKQLSVKYPANNQIATIKDEIEMGLPYHTPVNEGHTALGGNRYLCLQIG
jgi:hypothetical protein